MKSRPCCRWIQPHYCADSVDPAVHLPTVREIRDALVNTAAPPASTFVVVRGLVRPEWLIGWKRWRWRPHENEDDVFRAWALTRALHEAARINLWQAPAYFLPLPDLARSRSWRERRKSAATTSRRP